MHRRPRSDASFRSVASKPVETQGRFFTGTGRAIAFIFVKLAVLALLIYLIMYTALWLAAPPLSLRSLRTPESLDNSVRWIDKSNVDSISYGLTIQFQVVNVSPVIWDLYITHVDLSLREHDAALSIREVIELNLAKNREEIAEACRGTDGLLELFQDPTFKHGTSATATTHTIPIPDYFLKHEPAKVKAKQGGVPYGTCKQNDDLVVCNPASFAKCINLVRKDATKGSLAKLNIQTIALPMVVKVAPGRHKFSLDVEVTLSVFNTLIVDWKEACNRGEIENVNFVGHMKGDGRKSIWFPLYKFNVPYTALELSVTCASLQI